ncbi:MAG: DUF2680 domain-containing protein [Clostridia bacterium]|jgi:hypothetical protein|nr:DUF2680 domain-containing protein [Clostridia bacterium]
MKKAIVIVLALALFFGAASVALGSPDQFSAHKDKKAQLEFTPEQKAKALELKTELLELKKQVIQDNLKSGKITEEQAKNLENKVNKKLEKLQKGLQ